MRLRNRKTGERFTVEKVGGKFILEKEKSRNQFFQPIVEQSVSEKIAVDFAEVSAKFVQDLQTRFPKEMPAAQKAAIITQVETELKQNKIAVENLIGNPEFTKLITQGEVKHQVKTSSEYPSFVKLMGQLLVTSAFPKAALLFAMLPLIAGQNGLITHQGQPSNGLDLCASYILGCLQGYLTNGTAGWTSSIPQYSSAVVLVKNPPDPTAFKQLEDCVSIDKVGELVAKAYAKGGNNPMTCFYESSTWRNYNVTGEATSIPAANCDGLKSDFSDLTKQCMSWTGAAEKGVIIVGTVVGGIVVCCCATFIICYLKEKIKECCTRNPESSISRGVRYERTSSTSQMGDVELGMR